MLLLAQQSSWSKLQDSVLFLIFFTVATVSINHKAILPLLKTDIFTAPTQF